MSVSAAPTPSEASRIARIPRAVALGALAVYRSALSPLIHSMNGLHSMDGLACRYEPSCSEYARVAVRRHGVIRGGAMAMWRVARCNPFGGHGFDPVPAGGISLSRRILTRARKNREEEELN